MVLGLLRKASHVESGEDSLLGGVSKVRGCTKFLNSGDKDITNNLLKSLNLAQRENGSPQWNPLISSTQVVNLRIFFED